MKKKLVAILMGVVVLAAGGATLTACSCSGGNGDTGTTVTNGEDGKSAYQIWLDAGNTGTEADFIKFLTGSDGVDGTNGTDGTDGIGIEDVSVEVITLDFVELTKYTITLTDGTVLTKYTYPESPSSGRVDSDVGIISRQHNTCEAINEGDPEPELVYIVTYNYSSIPEYVYLSDMEILSGEVDYTKAGTYTLVVSYKGFITTVDVEVEGTTDESIDHVYNVETRTNTLWFSDDSVAENLKHIYMDLYLVNNTHMPATLTESNIVSGLPTSATYEGVSYFVFNIDGKIVEMPIYIVDSTCADFIADSDNYVVELPDFDEPVDLLKGQDLFSRINGLFTIQTELQGSTCTMKLPLTEEMLVKTDALAVEFSNETPGSYRCTLDLEKAGLPDDATITNTLDINVYDYDDSSYVTLRYGTLTGDNVIDSNKVNVSETFPKLYVYLNFLVNGNSYGIEDVLLTEEMIENIDEVDFSTPGYYDLSIKYEGLTCSPISIQVIDLAKSNIKDGYYVPRGSSLYEYTVGKKTVEDIQAQIIADHTKWDIMSISYYTKVDGQTEKCVIVTPEMIDFSCTDFTKLGSQYVYAVYGEGANQTRTAIARVNILPDADLTKVESTTYAAEDYSVVLYKNGIAEIEQVSGSVASWGTYTEDNGNLVISCFSGEMYFTLDTEKLTATPKAVEGTPTKTYKFDAGRLKREMQSIIVNVYTDYVVVGIEANMVDETSGEVSTEFVVVMTLSASSITKANTIYVLGMEYGLNEDGTLTPMIHAI